MLCVAWRRDKELCKSHIATATIYTNTVEGLIFFGEFGQRHGIEPHDAIAAGGSETLPVA